MSKLLKMEMEVLKAYGLARDSFDALKKYGRHEKGCPRKRTDAQCGCGLNNFKSNMGQEIK